MSSGARIDRKGYVFYNDMLFAVLKRVYGTFKYTNKKSSLIRRIIINEENKTIKLIMNMFKKAE